MKNRILLAAMLALTSCSCNVMTDTIFEAVAISIPDQGTVTGSGTYEFGADVVFEATPNLGYSFGGWYTITKSGKISSLISSESDYTFKMPNRNITYQAVFIPNNFNVVVNSEDLIKGTVTGSGTYAFGSSVKISATPCTDFSFNGWYLGGEKVSSMYVYEFDMPAKDIEIMAKFSNVSYWVSVLNEHPDRGIVTKDNIYEWGSEVTIEATPNSGCSFEGWYENGICISKDASYSFEMPIRNIQYEARFVINKHSVTATSTDFSKGTVTGNGTYEYGSKVTLHAFIKNETSTIDNPYKVCFDGWYNGSECLSTNKEYSFYMPDEDVEIEAHFSSGSKLTKGDILCHGSYPQSKVIDESIINYLINLAGDLPTTSNFNGWTPYNWYIKNSNDTKFGWHIDLDINDDGYFDYRGVYFTSYRPYDIEKGSLYKYQDSNGFKTSILYWFEYNPIEWRILNIDCGDYLLMSDKVIDSQQFYMPYSNGQKTDYQGNVAFGDPNNYKFSYLRTYLNTDFIFTAFNTSESARIQSTLVDNSLTSTGYLSLVNSTVCDDTQDKIFLPSFSDVTNASYGFKGDTYEDAGTFIYDEARLRGCSDYALCMGYHGGWWLRSPSSDRSIVRYVSGGAIYPGGCGVTSTSTGVVPMLHLK